MPNPETVEFSKRLTFSDVEQSGVMVQPHPALCHDRLFRDDPGFLCGVHLRGQDGGAPLRPLWRHLPLPQWFAAGQLLDTPSN